MKSLIASALALVCLLMPLASQGQPLSLSLRECVNITLERNLQMRTAGNSLEIAELTYATRKAAFLPNVNASANGFKNLGTTVDNFTQTIAQNPVQAQLGLGAGITLFRGLANWNSLRSAQYGTVAAEYGVQDAEMSLTLSVLQNFFTILFDEENLHLTQNRIELINTQLQRVKNQQAAGTATLGDVLNVESQLATEQLNLVNQQNALNRDKLALALLMNLEHGKDFNLSTPSMQEWKPVAVSAGASEIYTTASVNLPSVRQRELQILSNEYNMRAARSGSMPTLSANFGLGSFYSSASSNFIGFDSVDGGVQPVYAPADPFITQIGSNVNAQVQLSLSVPIFNNFSNRQQYLQAKVNLENSKLDLQRTQQDLYQRIMLAAQDADASKARFEATQIQLKSLEEAYSYARQRYEAGLLDFFSYNQTLNNKSNTEVQLLQAKYDYLLKSLVLDLYSGKEINF
jgi:outer membrane protein